MAAGKPKHQNGGAMRTYGAYVFKTKEPCIDEYRTLVEDHFGHRVTNKDLEHISEAGGPSSACMRGWLFGATERPQNATMEAAGRALGYHRVWQRMKKNTR
jgi:hypothetical protein